MTVREVLEAQYGHFSKDELWIMLAAAKEYSDSVQLKIVEVTDEDRQKMAAVDKVFRDYYRWTPLF